MTESFHTMTLLSLKVLPLRLMVMYWNPLWCFWKVNAPTPPLCWIVLMKGCDVTDGLNPQGGSNFLTTAGSTIPVCCLDSEKLDNCTPLRGNRYQTRSQSQCCWSKSTWQRCVYMETLCGVQLHVLRAKACCQTSLTTLLRCLQTAKGQIKRCNSALSLDSAVWDIWDDLYHPLKGPLVFMHASPVWRHMLCVVG